MSSATARQVDDAELTAFFSASELHAGNGRALRSSLLAGWAGLTDAPFNAFVDVYRPDKMGQLGRAAPSGR